MYQPILKKIWATISQEAVFQYLLGNADFVLSNTLQIWQQLVDFKETEWFYLDFLEQFKQKKQSTTIFEQEDNKTIFNELLQQFVHSFSFIKEDSELKKQVNNKRFAIISDIIRYKYHNHDTSVFQPFTNALIQYLLAPNNYIPIFSEEQKKRILINFIGTTDKPTSFAEQLKEYLKDISFVCNNEQNLTLLIAELLLHKEVISFWKSNDETIFKTELLVAAESEMPYWSAFQNKNEHPHNQILYGVSGTGKSFLARKRALEITEQQVIYNTPEIPFLFEKRCQEQQISVVTFHQSTFYEDFIEGIKPVQDKGKLLYEIRDGIFKKICILAQQNPTKNYVLILDEINRGNIAQIFGELITLLESDKRLDAINATKTILPYSQTPFGVPKNVYLIGTMNTSDKSIASLDIALRRRFIFEEIKPNYSLLSEHIEGINVQLLLETINQRLAVLLDKDHQIGHAYLMNISNLDELNHVFEHQIVPLLEEYFWGNLGKIGLVLGTDFVESQASAQYVFMSNFNYNEDTSFLDKTIYTISPFPKNASAFINIYKFR